MPVLKIVIHPSYYLRNKNSAVKKKYIPMDEFQKLIDDMIETMKAAKGVGLAAPQVAKNLRVMVVMDGDKPLVFINPRLYRKSLAKTLVEEGCLSVPGVWGMVKRHKSVSILALDRHGKKIKMRGKELLAIIFQHEMDHLKGILFIDKTQKFTNSPDL
jgi:peptide deformylase